MRLPSLSVPFLLLFLAGCQAATIPATQAAPDSPSPIDLATLPPTTTETSNPEATTSTEPIETCLANSGEFEYFDLESAFLDNGLQFRVWLPPCYGRQSDNDYPVLYLIHGQTFTDEQWDRIGADEAAARAISNQEYAPFIIVMPFDLSSTQPSIDPFRDAFIQELIPFVDANFRTLNNREYRALGGLSRGASWALHFALHYPELFSAVGGHSPPVFVEDAPRMVAILESVSAEDMPRIWLDIGEKDQQSILNSAIWFEELLTEMKIQHIWHLFPGFHNEEYWSSHVALYLEWYSQGW